MTPYGLGLLSFFEGHTGAQIIIRRDDGIEIPLPASHFFRSASQFTPIENKAIKKSYGQILDIGAGTGIHSLALQASGFTVTAIDIDPNAVRIMAARGVKTAFRADMSDYEGGPFDTILLLGHGIGITGTIDGLQRFLVRARQLTRKGGQVLLDSLDVRKTTDEGNLNYHKRNVLAGRYVGETRIQAEFRGLKGPFFNWLHIDPVTLAEYAGKEGWNCEILLNEDSGEYLARLVRDP